MNEINPAQQAQAREQIENLRKEVDEWDRIIANAIVQRVGLVEEIGRIKLKAKLNVYDPTRETKQFAHYEALADFYHVQPEQIIEPFRTIVRLSKLAQQGRSLASLRQRRPPGKSCQ